MPKLLLKNEVKTLSHAELFDLTCELRDRVSRAYGMWSDAELSEIDTMRVCLYAYDDEFARSTDPTRRNMDNDVQMLRDGRGAGQNGQGADCAGASCPVSIVALSGNRTGTFFVVVSPALRNGGLRAR